MRAIVIPAARAFPEVAEVPDPAPPPGGVVVRVDATGMCLSDWHAWAGHDDDVVFPHVPGHELAGEVVELGTGVTRWRVGDRVTVPFVCGCGRCEWCSTGNAQVCPNQQQPGFTHAGSFAEYVALHAADVNLVSVPAGLDAAAAASLGCRFATAYRAIVGRARLREGEWLTVVGVGGVGLSAVMIAVAIGARVIAVDRNPQALAAAADLGAEHTLDANRVEITASVAELSGGGSHVSIDAVGSEVDVCNRDPQPSSPRSDVPGGTAPATGWAPTRPMSRVISWELDVLGSHGMAATDYPEMLAMIDSGRLRPQRLITRRVGLDDAAALLPTLDRAGTAGITVIDPIS